MDVKLLWQKRLSSFLKEAATYSRYIANSGSITFLILAFIGGSYYYSQLLRTIPPELPVEWGMALLFAFLLGQGKIRTFIKEADRVFILPAEKKMGTYFQRSILYSIIVQSIVIFLLLMILWPLYRHRMGEETMPFLQVFFTLVALKAVNVLAVWREMRFSQRGVRSFHKIIRMLVLVPVLYFYFSQGPGIVWLCGVLGLLAVSFFYYRSVCGSCLLRWDDFIQEENRAMSRFYRFVNGFVDVPEIGGTVHSRTWLAKIPNRLSFTQENTYLYLILKSFIRSDLFGIIVRMIIVGLAVIFFIPGDWGKGTAYFFFVYLVGVQLVALGQIHAHVFWFYLYPVDIAQRRKAIQKVNFWVLSTVSLLLAVPLLLTFQSIYLPIAALVFAFVMVGYLRKRTTA